MDMFGKEMNDFINEMNTNFKEMIELQRKLDNYIESRKNIKFVEIEKIINNNFYAMVSELVEIQDCFYWKHWKGMDLANRFALKNNDVEHLQEEIVDFLHFVLQLFYKVNDYIKENNYDNCFNGDLFAFMNNKNKKVLFKTYMLKVIPNFKENIFNKIIYNLFDIIKEVEKIKENINSNNFKHIIISLTNIIYSFLYVSFFVYYKNDKFVLWEKYKEKNKINMDRQDNGY